MNIMWYDKLEVVLVGNAPGNKNRLRLLKSVEKGEVKYNIQ